MTKDIQLMIENLGQFSVREQRDILLNTVRNLVDHVESAGTILDSTDTIAEFLQAASGGRL